MIVELSRAHIVEIMSCITCEMDEYGATAMLIDIKNRLKKALLKNIGEEINELESI